MPHKGYRQFLEGQCPRRIYEEEGAVPNSGARSISAVKSWHADGVDELPDKDVDSQHSQNTQDGVLKAEKLLFHTMMCRPSNLRDLRLAARRWEDGRLAISALLQFTE